MALTEQKRRYAAARLSGLSKKESAVAAGCPEKTASQAASRYEKDVDVQAAMGRQVVVEQRQKEAPPADPDTHIPAQAEDPLTFLKNMMNDLKADPKLRLDAAKALAGFTVSKPGEKGKKDQQQEKAQETANKFAVRRGLQAVK